MDKISQLPDDLLTHVLSSVPTKDVIAMSILSKRWRSIWTLVPRLIIGDYLEEHEYVKRGESSLKDMTKFLMFVSRTLRLHKAPVLESFHLNIALEISPWEFDLWVGTALERFVRDLKIHCCYKNRHTTLPSRLFTSETLETLELRNAILLEVPSQISFRSLKTLRLISMKYKDEESFVKLISNCPVLEALVVEICRKYTVETFTINVPSLQSLSISHALQCFGTDYNVFVVHYHSLKQLTTVNYFDQLDFVGNNMPELVEANLRSLSSHAKVLASFPNLKRLSLCLGGEAPYPTGTVLLQLVRLELCLCESNWTNMLLSVLQHCPRLQVLKLVLNHFREKDRKVVWIQSSCVPECLLFHLKTFQWRDYHGSEEEKVVAIYILKKAMRLVTATIYPDSLDLASKKQMFEELEIGSRGSRVCELKMI